MQISLLNLLSEGRKKATFLMPFAALFVAMICIAGVVQINSSLNQIAFKSSADKFAYLQISKEVGVSTTLGLSPAHFLSNEIEALKKQSFIDQVGPLFTNDFRVYGRFAGNSFDMFFTAVNGDFIDADTSNFLWEQGDDYIPVIISNQYLTLLNHAVLPSQGKPPMPKSVITKLSLDLVLSKNDKKIKTRAKVVGFSDRISSVLVPKNFLDYANTTLSGSSKTRVSMLLLKVKSASDARLQKYLARNDYKVVGELPFIDQAKQVLLITLTVLSVLGAIILLLSIGLLSAQLKAIVLLNSLRLKMLILLGYAPSLLLKKLFKPLIFAVGILCALTSILLYLGYSAFQDWMYSMNFYDHELSLTSFFIPVFIGCAVLFYLRFTLSAMLMKKAA